jgi:hypothetical protein
MKTLGPVVFGMLLLVSPNAFGQHMPKDMPKWKRGESLTDKQKLRQLERKAAYEQSRVADFAKRGIKGYKATKQSLMIRLPDSFDDAIKRLEQLTRVQREASPAAIPWIEYERKLLHAYAQHLIDSQKQKSTRTR